MAEKTPIRLVFDGSTPTGIAEYQTGDTIGNSFLTNSSFSILDDSSTSTAISLGNSLQIVGSGGITTSLSGSILTITVGGSIVTETSTDTLTNKTIDLGDNTITGSLTEFNTALQGDSFVSLTGSETLTNKTLTTPVISSISNTGTLTLPTSTDTLIGRATTDTLTNKTIDADNNTVTNIGPSELSDTAVTAGSYGSSTAIPTFTVDAQGRLTAASTASISSNMSIAGDSGTDTITVGTDTFTIAGGTGLSSTATTDTITLNIDSTVATLTGSQTLTNKTLTSPTITGTGAIAGTFTGDVTGNADTATALATARTIAGQSFDGSANITIAATDLSDTNQSLSTSDNVQFANLVLSGNLTVNGTTTTVATTNTTVTDSLIELGNGTTGTPSNDAGIVIERGSSDNAFIGYDESDDKFKVGTGLFTGASTGNLTITTGTLVANLEGNVTGDVTGNSDTATTLATARTIAGQSFDGSANITIASTDLSDTSSIVLLNSTQTLTNKTLTSPTITGTGAIAGTFTGNVTGDVTGNADTATALETARTIAGQSFDGSANITIASTDLSNTSDIVLLTSTQTLTNKTLTSPTITGTGAIAGTFTGDITGDVTGNADTATTLATARTIAGQSFDGSTNITIASTDLSNTSNITLNDATQTLTNKSISTSQIDSGTFADARIAESNVTQHQSALSITESQISDLSPFKFFSGTTTTTTVPAASSDFDLAKVPSQTGSVETPFTNGTTDAFGVSVSNFIYDMMDPVGETTTVDLGAFS